MKMVSFEKEIAAIVLAGGKGTRMNSAKPKVLHEIAGQPMISYSLDVLRGLGLKKIVIVVGYGAEEVKSFLGEVYDYALQEEQLGTGHAVAWGLKEVSSEFSHVLVVYGDDSGFYKKETLKSLVDQHLAGQATLSFITLEKINPAGLGRIVRDSDGKVIGIVEEKMATEDQKKITEVNDGCYIFERDWLDKNLDEIKLNTTGEYYLTDLVAVALKKGVKVSTFKLVDKTQYVGVNTPEQLEIADQLMRKKLNEKRR